MAKTREIRKKSTSKPVMEGAGVHLRRAFGFTEVPLFDPFLLLDDFRSEVPEHYIKGFPWHPHRGIETITYVLRGDVEHGDSMGNKGVIGAGDLQWMTAGSGIIHQEMPTGDAHGFLWGFQLWANLPSSHKMMDPRYRDVKMAETPEVTLEGGVRVRIISGELNGQKGPVADVVIEPEYLDVAIPAGGRFVHATPPGRTVFAYVIGGNGRFGDGASPDAAHGLTADHDLVLFAEGDRVAASAENAGMRFLLVSGKPLKEPVAWQGPIVMNTREELKIAFDEYNKGKFIKHKA